MPSASSQPPSDPDPPPARRRSLHYLGDPDVLQAAVITVLLVLLTGGLIWLAYLWQVVRIARSSATRPPQALTALVFGCGLRRDAPGREYRVRLARALMLARSGQAPRLLVLGGRSGGQLSEAAAGGRWLREHDLPESIELLLDPQSTDSLQNLKNARRLLCGDDAAAALPPVALVTSRYHLARCLLLARRLGFDATPVAAEERLAWSVPKLRRLWLESGYLMWIDVGVRWAELIGHSRIAQRVS